MVKKNIFNICLSLSHWRDTTHTTRINGQLDIINGDIYDGLATYGLPGDSGSPLFAYDAKEKRWVLAAVLSTFANYDRTENIYTIIQPDVIAQAFKNDEIQIPFRAKEIQWRNLGNGDSVLKNGAENIHVALESSSKKLLDQNTQRPSLDNGKTIHFQGGDGSTLILKDSINQGAGLYTSIKMPLFEQKIMIRLG